ncbi:MAG TPA: hypothetical protein VFT22_07325 [Kofleriaceae bacterium]|nr:hypothetical protein [Kofleriaceae bacterium]
MATEGYIETQSLVAAADYSAASNQGKIVRIDTAAAEQAIIVSTLGARGDAVLMNKPKLGEACELVTDGFGKALCGAAIASGGLELTPDATGRLIAAVSGNFVFAISRGSTAAAGEWVGIKLCGPYAKP